MMQLLARQLSRSVLDDYCDDDVLCVKTAINLERLREIYARVCESFVFLAKDQLTGYDGICLQYGDVKNKLYDGLNNYKDASGQMRVVFNYPSYFNEVGEMFKSELAQLPHVKLRRGRLLRAWPQFSGPMHTDGPRSRRLHIPIYTAPGADIVIDGEPYHMPADGSAYVLNTEKMHFLRNLSDTVRVHLVFDL